MVNLHDGARLGLIEEPEVIIDPNTGSLESLLVPNQRGIFDLFTEGEALVIPWEAIVKIGAEIIIVDLPQEESR